MSPLPRAVDAWKTIRLSFTCSPPRDSGNNLLCRAQLLRASRPHSQTGFTLQTDAGLSPLTAPSSLLPL